MTTFIYILAVTLGLVGVIGSVAPVLPGPLLGLIGLFLLHFATPLEFTTGSLIMMTILTVATMLADYFLPIASTKKHGGSREGIRGSAIGLIIGVFIFPPRGLIIFPLIGAYIGELYAKKSSTHARKAARGTFVGSMLSTLLRLIVSVILLRQILAAVIG